jgi:hypothetical protein
MGCLGRGRAHRKKGKARLSRPSLLLKRRESPPFACTCPHPASIQAPSLFRHKDRCRRRAQARDAALACVHAEWERLEGRLGEGACWLSSRRARRLRLLACAGGAAHRLSLPASCTLRCCRSLRPLLCRTTTVLLLSGPAVPASAACPGDAVEAGEDESAACCMHHTHRLFALARASSWAKSGLASRGRCARQEAMVT